MSAGAAGNVRTPEAVLEPDLPICDAHHHLWPGSGHTGAPYELADLRGDTGSGHNVLRTVFVECHSEYLRDGPEHLRPVGETAFVADAAEASARSGGAEIAGIVAHADLCLGDAVEEVLVAHEGAGRGRFRGIRYTTAHDEHPMNNTAARSGIMGEDGFRRGVRKLGQLGHSYDVFCFHPQLSELVELARACPEVTIVANHLGVPIAGGPYRGRADEVRAFWQQHLAELARCENVVLKVGGLTRPLTGDRWDRRGEPASSEEIATAWGDEMRYAIDHFGPARCMFESNFPVDKSCFGYVECWNAFKRVAAEHTAAEKRDLFHDTAARAYRLPQVVDRGH
ncbi:MAG: amidohydrolase family protein [Acidimicrobiia bacterium]|nr:amidohydrolase family protein [Acidimicrobiia bacterium]